jgi:hypothetical protein
MAAPRGRRTTARQRGEKGGEAETAPPADGLLRRALGLGLASFFSGEEVLRKALGDTVPREWVEFASAQSERTRRDFAERLAAELGKSLRAIELDELAKRLLQGHTVEINARVRFLPRAEDEGDPGHSVRVRVAPEEKS